MRTLIRAIVNLLSIRPGEGRKVILLYALQMVFFLGLAWGDAARESLFLANWSPDDLAFMFILNAVVGFMLGILYASFADRISNSRLLYGLIGLLVVWLISVRFAFELFGGSRGLAYPYFYVSFVALRDLTTLHLITYINDFFDTRSAKRLLPLLLSAGIAGATLAGFSGALLNNLVGLENVPLAWSACLLVMLVILFFVQRLLKKELAQIEQAQHTSHHNTSTSQRISAWENLRQGYNFVRQSGLLRWMALAAFLMMVMLNLLFYQSSRIFVTHFNNDRVALFNFYNLLGGVGNITGLMVQSLLLSRLVARLGVGSMNLLFPTVSLLAALQVNLFPSFGSGIFTRLDTTLGRQAFRNPLDAMLYNSVPLDVKTRSRSFVSSLVLPLGTLAAGMIILLIKFTSLAQDAPRAASIVTTLAIGSSAAYLLVMLKVKQEYGRALANLLTRDEVAIFRLSSLDSEQPDPATLELLYHRMQDTPDDRQAILIAEMVYQIEERGAFPEVLALARQHSPTVRAGIIELIATDWITDPGARRLCLESLADPNPGVQQAASQALFASPDLPQDKILLEAFADLLLTAQPTIQALIIPTLLRYGAPHHQAAAQAVLNEWVSIDPDQPVPTRPFFDLALQALAQTGDERLQTLLEPELDSQEPGRILQAISLLHTCLEARVLPGDAENEPSLSPLQDWAVRTLATLLSSPAEVVRLAALQGLLDPPTDESQTAVWKALGDSSLAVRQIACEASSLPQAKLEEGMLSLQAFRAEACALLLSRSGSFRAQRRLLDMAQLPIRQAYAFHQLRLPLTSAQTPGSTLLDLTLRQGVESQLDRLFWLLTGLTDLLSTQHIRRALSGHDPIARANAAEALDALTTPSFAARIIPLLDGTPANSLGLLAANIYALPAQTSIQTLRWAWPALAKDPDTSLSVLPASVLHPDGWLTCLAMRIVHETSPELAGGVEPYQRLLRRALENSPPLVQETASRIMAKQEPVGASDHPDPILKEGRMLSSIEKVLFLQEVPFFTDMPLQELRILASISEEKTYPADVKIFSQGDATSSLYVIIAGRVAVQQQGKRQGWYTRLAELGPREYFAEVSLFDEQPHAADILTMEPVDLLIIRRATLVALVRNQPEIGLTLLKALSQRLRKAYADMNAKTQARPKPIQDMLDAFKEDSK